MNVSPGPLFSQSTHGEFAFYQQPVTLFKSLKSDPHAVPRVAVHDLAINNNMLITHWNSQSEDGSLRQISLGVHIQAADADVFCTGNPGRVSTVEEDVDDQAGPVMGPPFLL